MFSHEYWMTCALQLAERAKNEGEIPIGAVLVYKNKIISEGWNQSISLYDPTAHAEIIALRKGGKILKNYRLLKCTLYVTLEPCIMCIGAILNGRIDTLVYGASDTKTKTVEFILNSLRSTKIFHKMNVIGGVMSPLCIKILHNFFRMRRLEKRKIKYEQILNLEYKN